MSHKTLAEAVDASYPFGVPFQACPYMVGMKKAALVDGKAMVSPAMLDLIQNSSDGDELRWLLERIPIVTITMGPMRLDATQTWAVPGDAG